MTTYHLAKKKTAIVSAVPFDGTNFVELALFCGSAWFIPVPRRTRAGHTDVVAEVFNTQHYEWVGVRAGQWVIRGVVGELYPVDVDALHGGYEAPEGGWPE